LGSPFRPNTARNSGGASAQVANKARVLQQRVRGPDIMINIRCEMRAGSSGMLHVFLILA
jgi:hypothetical protein